MSAPPTPAPTPAAAPAPAPPADAPGPNAAADDEDNDEDNDEDQTLTIDKTTIIRIATTHDPRPSPTGRGFVQSIDFEPATLADLKADQSVVVCIRDEVAVKVTILAGNAKP